MLISTREHAFNTLQDMYINRKFTDVALISGDSGVKINVHRSVLCSALEYFDLMFSAPFNESEQSEITIHGVDPEILEIVVGFLYIGKINIPNMETAKLLMAAAHYMNIEQLQKHVRKYMNKMMTPENCLGLHLFCQRFAEEHILTKKSLEVAVRNLPEVIKGEEFSNLSKDNMVNFIVDAKFAADENDLAQAILSWIDFQEDRSKLHFKELLRLLNVGLIVDKDIINQFYTKCTDLEDSMYIVNCLHDELYAVIEDDVLLKPNPNALLFVQPAGSHKNIFRFDFLLNKFVKKYQLQINENVNVIAVWNEQLVMIENIKNQNMFHVSTYDISRKESNSIGIYDLLENVGEMVLGNDLYLLSPFRFYKIDLTSGKFETISTYYFSIKTCVAIKGKPYFVVADKNDNTAIKIVSLNNNIQDRHKWSTHKTFVDKTNFIGSVAYDNCLYHLTEKTVHIYNPESDEFSSTEYYLPKNTKLDQVIGTHMGVYGLNSKSILKLYKQFFIIPDSDIQKVSYKKNLKMLSLN